MTKEEKIWEMYKVLVNAFIIGKMTSQKFSDYFSLMDVNAHHLMDQAKRLVEEAYQKD